MHFVHREILLYNQVISVTVLTSSLELQLINQNSSGVRGMRSKHVEAAIIVAYCVDENAAANGITPSSVGCEQTQF